MNDNIEFKQNWYTLKEFVKQASNMNPGDTGSGMKKAYLMMLKLMDMIEDDGAEGVVCRNGIFKKEQNILSIK